VADNIRRELVFNTGGRPYNNRDFETIQTAFNDIKLIFDGFVNKNSEADPSVFNKSSWIISGFKGTNNEYFPGISGVVWLNGEFRYVDQRSFPAGFNGTTYYIVPEDDTESRLYKDGNVKTAFNLYSAKWVVGSEFTNPHLYMAFSSVTDMKNAKFESSTFVNSIRVLSTDGGSVYHNMTNELTFAGENGFSIYKDANNVIRFKQFSSSTTLPDANAVVITTSTKTLTTSSISTTELNYLSGVSSNIQTQLDDKISTVGTSDILNKAVTTTKLADGAVTTDKIASNAVTSTNLVDGAVTTDKIVTNAVTTDKIASNAVTSDELVDGAVTTDKIVSNAVTTDKIASNAVTSDKLDTNIVIDGNVWIKGTLYVDTNIKCLDDITAFDTYTNPVTNAGSSNTSSGSSSNYSWQTLIGFTSDYESDQNNPAKYRIDYDGNVYFSGIVKRKTATIKSGEIWAVLPDELNPVTQTNIRFNISSVQLDEFIYSTLTFDGTNFNADIKILGKQIDECANTITSFYLNGITYNKLF